jgi:hypothetical protein
VATEKFSNDAQSTLTAAIAAGDASLTVASAAAFPSSGNFRLLIDSEILLVTAVAGNTFTVGRGQEGTTAAAHANGAYATHVLTAGALTGHFASLENANTYLALNTFGAGLITSPFGSGTNNEAFGAGAGRGAATGSNNTFVGQGAGAAITGGSSNAGFGQLALQHVTSGAQNCAFGVQACQNVTTGSANMGIGLNALNGVSTGGNNVGVGVGACNGGDVNNNVGIGYNACQSTGANDNVGVGVQSTGGAGAGNTGGQNVGVGTRALKQSTGGSDLVAVGYQAGQAATTGTQNTLLGSQSDVGSGSLSDVVGLGYKATPTAGNEFALSPYLNELTLHGLSSTGTDRLIAEIDWAFATSTDASRKGRLTLGAHDASTAVGSPREGFRVESDGSNPLIGFYGVSAIARAVLATGAGHTVDDVISALQNLGLVKQS